jgi:hypothetical protein
VKKTIIISNFCFQTELDSLESERGELRNKLKESAKKALLDGITRQGLLGSSGAASLGASGALSLGPSVPNPVKVSNCFFLYRNFERLKLLILKIISEKCNNNRQHIT